ncbi:hypothetical protein DAEQUDRAFT_769369 [Daedalea quercina L-15889]|uniref:Endopeptidase S2P n=1 Tax=Daedalea quercina L-15889 TaxID=1314783 RepID=A0A165LSJ3_9APHY|nr:hypothetical protein DAEQUDRAFT_769369 [Daedalea quercina L-15889]
MSLFSTLFSALYALAGLWAALHLLACLLLPGTPRVPQEYYPPPTDTSRLFVTERILFLGVRTTLFNRRADWLADWLEGKGRSFARAARAVYDVGCVLAAAGMLAALGLLTWTAARLAGAVLGSWAGTGSAASAAHMWKRDEAAEAFAESQAGYGIPVYAIIPGVTVPLSHIPLLLVVLISSQIIHELGHLITAALENVPVITVGLSINVIIPSAFVALSHGALRELPAPARLRIASSGAFHNLVLYLLFSALARAPIPGYRDVSAWGRVVARVQPGSPLEGHLPVGAIVTKIDDDFLSAPAAAADADADAWTVLLSRADAGKNAGGEGALGWCVDRRWFVDQPAVCCMPGANASLTQTSCFVAYPPLALDRCVDPVPYLGDSVEAPAYARCTSTVECGAEQVCMGPRDDQMLLRLTVHLPTWAAPARQLTDRIVVWNGPRREILEEVEVTTYAPCYSLLPLLLPSILTSFLSYFTALNLSLFLFNLVPLSFLDGAPCFSALFDIAVLEMSRVPAPAVSDPYGRYGGTRDADLAALEGGGSPSEHWHTRFDARARWKRRLKRVIHLVSVVLVGASIVLGIVVGMSG